MTGSAPPPTLPSPGDLQRIVSQADPVIRNLQITQCYFELSALLADRLGPGANWCTFAAWASKQAGQTIRGEDLRRALERALEDLPGVAQAIAELAGRLQAVGSRLAGGEMHRLIREIISPAAAADRAAAAVARGNLKVFAEIGPEFARFLPLCLPSAAPDAEALRLFGEGLRPGDPPEGQGFLRSAFTHYYRARFTEAAPERAELLLLANIEIGFHEQTRLQPDIAAALDAALLDPREVADRLLQAALPGAGWLGWGGALLKRLLGRLRPVYDAVNRLVAEVRRQVRRIISEHLMTLTLPGGQLCLGRDLQGAFPPALQHLHNAELQALLARLDPTPDSLRQTGADDWADLPDRLHFIIDLFRSYQEDATLLNPPFTPEQTAALKAGRRPDGEL